MSNKVKTQLVIDGKNNAGRAFSAADKQLSGLSSAAKKAGVALLGAFSVGAIASWVNESIKAADQSRKLAQSAGLTTQAFTGLAFAAQQSGLNNQQLANSFGRLSQVITQAAQGSERQAALFRNMGVSIKDAEGNLRSGDAVFADIADRFAGMPDGIEKSALAAELFGRNLGTKLIPLLNGGAEGLKALTDQAERLGLVITDEQAQASEQFNDTLSALGGVSKGAANTVANELLPTLNEMSGLLLDLAEDGESAKVVAQALGLALKVLAISAIAAGAQMQIVGRTIGAAAAAAVQAATGNFRAAAEIMRDVAEENGNTARAAGERIKKLWEGGYAAAGEEAANTARQMREIEAQMRKSAEESHKAFARSYRDLTTQAKAALRELVSDEKAAQREIEGIRKKRLDIEARYAEAIAGFGGGRGGPSFGQAQDLKIAARRSLAAGDIEGAQKQAQAALKVLQQLSDAGENTYGFEGFAKELQRIEVEANKLEESRADEKLKSIQAQVEDLSAKVTELTEFEINIELTETEKQKILKQMKALADQIGQTLSFQVGGSGESGQSVQGFATGGAIRGAGTGTSDSILIRASNGEYMIKAAAVRKYGTNLLDQINGMRLPKYADGGLVGNAAPSGGGTPLNLTIDGSTYPLSGSPDVIAALALAARNKKLRGGR